MGRMTDWMFWIALILLFGAGLLFGLAVANAEASEAWVLWSRRADDERTDWMVERTVPSFEDCDYVQSRLLLWARLNPNKPFLNLVPGAIFTRQDVVGPTITMHFTNDSDLSVKFLCLPTTIDPRPHTGR
jgi:hypothetical protein